MKKQKRLIFLFMTILSVTIIFCGCGMNNNNATNSSGTQSENDKVNLYSPGEFGTTTAYGIEPEPYGAGSENVTDSESDAAEEIGDATNNLVDDVADGVGDAVDNLGGGSFDKYEDAREYLLGKLQQDNAGAKYEVREENKDLTAYNHNDSGAEGYQFSVYETDRNEKIGIYYVDKDTGKIYRYMGKNSIEAY